MVSDPGDFSSLPASSTCCVSAGLEDTSWQTSTSHQSLWPNLMPLGLVKRQYEMHLPSRLGVLIETVNSTLSPARTLRSRVLLSEALSRSVRLDTCWGSNASMLSPPTNFTLQPAGQ